MSPPGMDCPSAEARPRPRRVADLCDARGCLGSRSGLHNKPTAWMAWFGKPYRAYQPWVRPVPDVLDLAAPNGRLQPALSTNWCDAVRVMETPRKEAPPGLSNGANPLAEYLQCLLTPFPPSLPSPQNATTQTTPPIPNSKSRPPRGRPQESTKSHHHPSHTPGGPPGASPLPTVPPQIALVLPCNPPPLM